MTGNFQHFKKFALARTWETTYCITSMALSPDGKVLAYSEFDDWTFKDSGFNVFDLIIGQQICYFDTGRIRDYGRSFALSPSGREIVWSRGSRIMVGDLTTEKIRTIYPNSLGKQVLNPILISPNGQRVICFSEKVVNALDLATGQTIDTLQASSELIKFVATSSDGEIIISQSGNAIAFWDSRSGQQIGHFTIILRDSRTGKELRSFKALTKPVKCLTLSPDRQTLIPINFNDAITHWDIKTGKETKTFEWRYHPVEAISANSSVMITSGKDGIIIWALSNGKKLHVLPKDAVNSLVISANDRTIAYTKHRGGYGGYIVKVWQAF